YVVRSVDGLGRSILGRIIIGLAGDRVFIWAAVDLWRLVKVAVWRRSRGLPLQRGGVPRIVRCHRFAVFDAPEKIEDERNLRQPQANRGPKNVLMHVDGGVRQAADQ